MQGAFYHCATCRGLMMFLIRLVWPVGLSTYVPDRAYSVHLYGSLCS